MSSAPAGEPWLVKPVGSSRLGLGVLLSQVTGNFPARGSIPVHYSCGCGVESGDGSHWELCLRTPAPCTLSGPGPSSAPASLGALQSPPHLLHDLKSKVELMPGLPMCRRVERLAQGHTAKKYQGGFQTEVGEGHQWRPL